MQERHLDRERYFNEQARTTSHYYIPYLKSHIGELPKKVLEVGCGEGGNLLPFAEAGCEVVGVDLAASRIEQAKLFFAEREKQGTFIASDIFKMHEFKHSFPLIIVHDVIEHIGDKAGFLRDLKEFLAPGGYIYMGFPAWQMPFGGHQQIAESKFVAHAPFLHLLPRPLYRSVLKMFGVTDGVITELLSIKETRCPIELFLNTVKNTGLKVVNRQLYFINPHYETKFGLRPRKLWKAIAAIPYLRNFVSTTCFFILKAER